MNNKTTDHKDTEFASAERSSFESIFKDYNIILNAKHLEIIFAGLPNLGLVLNENRQIVFCNEAVLSSLGFSNASDVLGLRPGEAFQCIHSAKTDAGCGTSGDCRFCGAINAVLESQKTSSRVTKESRLTSDFNGSAVSFDLRATASPITINNLGFTMVIIEDISHEKRNEVLEKTFLHDLAGMVSNIHLISEHIARSNPDIYDIKEVDTLFNLCSLITETVRTQRTLRFLEEGDADINFENVDMDELYSDIKKSLSFNEQANSVGLEYDSCGISIKTDKVTLYRIIYNLIINAIEASDKGDTVRIMTYKDPVSLNIEIWNPAEMTDEVKSQVFQRSFSTKGKGRGIGTYSAKLFTERYLGGSVSFRSEKEQGTTFKVSIPVKE